ncbi:HEAT repeat domain-containing protein [Argonema galeatum]|uniref:HEAT repeat domain-containing protein n=1 Tax=Argonema galeatum TaxID=2942762 RepID=UPI002012A009|nr:HEAT repeat domain-containing protein [Argonema galeatum]MCL1464443.1 HEAT repeat domain-containing protein [Argonema galeatum A003/A1]
MTNNLIQAVEQADTPGTLIAAVRALADARLEAGIPTLIAALGYNNPGAALLAVEGLVQIGVSAVEPLLEKLDGYNYGARAYAIRALAAIADPLALEVLNTAALNDFAPSVRRAAAKGLGNLHWHKLSPEQIQSAQEKAFDTLRQVSQDSDWSIRYAAIVGLQLLAKEPSVKPHIQTHLQQMLAAESDRAVRARVQLATVST